MTNNQLIDAALKSLREGQPMQAFMYLSQAKSDQGAVRDLHLVWAMYHLSQNQIKDACDSLRKELASFPNNKVAAELLEENSGTQQTAPVNALSAKKEKTRILMPYSIERDFGDITLPHWIKQSLQKYFSNEVEVIGCGPGNDINLPDTDHFYANIQSLIADYQIDWLLDIEGGASHEFMFKHVPSNLTIPKIYWAIDTHQFLNEQVEKAKHYDFIFSSQKNAVAAFGRKGAWLPAGASLHEIDYQLPRDIDVGFIGNIHPRHAKRKEIVEFLKAQVPGFACYQNVFLKDKSMLASRMKIMVNASLNNDINFRVFETLACGSLLLTDRINFNGLEDLFVDGEHLVTYSGPQDLLEKIRYYLAHPDQRERIARAGQALVEQKYRHHVLLKTVLAKFREIELQKKDKGTQTTARTCWCGGQLVASVHPLYKTCSECKTQVLERLFTEEELKSFYSAQGYWHDRQVQVFNYPPIEQRAVDDFKDRIPAWFEVLHRYKKSPEHLLEIGCAHGGFLHYCRQNGAKNVVGVEVDEATCSFARSQFSLPHVVSGLFPKTNLPFESFDAITGFDVIEHFTDPVAGLAAVAQHLKDDGICFFQTPCYRGEGSEWNQFKPAEHTFLYNPESITKLFDRVGLAVIDILPGYFPDDMFVIGKKKSKRQKIFFVRSDSIGDNILAAGMLPHLRKHYRDSEIIVICDARSKELYEACPHINGVLAYDRKRFTEELQYRNEFLMMLAAEKPDLVLNSVFSREVLTDFLTMAGGAQKTMGFNGNLNNIFQEHRDSGNRLYTNIFESSTEHCSELKRHEEFLAHLGIQAENLQPEVYLTPEDELFASDFFEKNRLVKENVVCFSACSQFEIKDYAHWKEALFEICHQQNLSVIALGTAKDYHEHQRILDSLGIKSFNLCGKTTLRQTAALIKRSRIVVAVDTSVPHLACAVGTPNVVVLGGGHFGRFFPYSKYTSAVCLPLECYGCSWRCKYATAHCVKDIDPASITAAIRYSLASTALKPRLFMQDFGNSNSTQWRPPLAWVDASEVEIIMVTNPVARVPQPSSGNSLNLVSRN